MKTVSKTLRLTPETIQKIEEWPGDSFTQKFSSMVDWMFSRRAAMQKDLKRLERQRTALLTEISDLEKVRNSLNRLNQSINNSIWSIGEIEKSAKQAQSCVDRICLGDAP